MSYGIPLQKKGFDELEAYITSASKGCSGGASPRYCHAAWHQHLKAANGMGKL
jgi:hypothetical protein